MFLLPGITAAFDKQLADYEQELAASLDRDVAENKDKEVCKEYESAVILPIKRKYAAKRDELEAEQKAAKKEKDKKKEKELQSRIDALKSEEKKEIDNAPVTFSIAPYYKARNARLAKSRKRVLSFSGKKRLPRVEKTHKEELQAAYNSKIAAEIEVVRQDFAHQMKADQAERIENETIRRYEIYFLSENSYDTAKEVAKDLEKIKCNFLTYDKKALQI